MRDSETQLRAEARAVNERAAALADTDEAFARFTHAASEGAGELTPVADTRRPMAWIGTAAAVAFVTVGVAATLLVGGDRNDRNGDVAAPGTTIAVAAGVPASASEPAVEVTAPQTSEMFETSGTPERSGTSGTSAAAVPATLPDAPMRSDPTVSTPAGTGLPVRSCTYTDPGRIAINVHRALEVPGWDGRVGDRVRRSCERRHGVPVRCSRRDR